MHQLRGVELKRFLRKIKKPKIELYLLLQDVQYARNVAGIFRTAEAMGVKKIFLTGVSRKPPFGKALRKASRNKEQRVYWEYVKDAGKVIQKMQKRDFQVIGLEITDKSTRISEKNYTDKVMVVVGSEMFGIKKSVLERLDGSVYIPMYGKGSSLNVGVATGIVLNNIINKFDEQN